MSLVLRPLATDTMPSCLHDGTDKTQRIDDFLTVRSAISRRRMNPSLTPSEQPLQLVLQVSQSDDLGTNDPNSTINPISCPTFGSTQVMTVTDLQRSSIFQGVTARRCRFACRVGEQASSTLTLLHDNATFRPFAAVLKDVPAPIYTIGARRPLYSSDAVAFGCQGVDYYPWAKVVLDGASAGEVYMKRRSGEYEHVWNIVPSSRSLAIVSTKRRRYQAVMECGVNDWTTTIAPGVDPSLILCITMAVQESFC